MASGPENYNHRKVFKARNKGISLSNAAWFSVIQEVTDLKSKKATENCDEHCKIRAIAVIEILHFALNSSSHYIERLRNKWSITLGRRTESGELLTSQLANPNFTPGAVYLSGVGSYPSMVHYDGQWWIVYGILKRKINNVKNTKIYVLHNPRCVIAQMYLDDLKDNFFPRILASEIENLEE